MKKQLIYTILLLVMTAFVAPIQAQDTDSIRIRDLQNALEESRDELHYCRIIIDSLRKQNQMLSAKVRPQDNNSSELINNYRKKLYECERRLNSLLMENKDLRVETENKELRIHELQKYKYQVEPLVKRQLVEMSTTVVQKWLSKTYAEINKEELEDELALFEAFKDEDKGVGEAYTSLKTFYENFMLYQRGVEVVNSPYEADTVSNLVVLFADLSGKEKHLGRKMEIDNVYSQLRDYKYTIMYFQIDVIAEIDSLLNSYKRDGTHKAAWKQIKNYLDHKDDGLVEAYMNKIPWLGIQYHQYRQQLEVDPYGQNTAREIIMKLKP